MMAHRMGGTAHRLTAVALTMVTVAALLAVGPMSARGVQPDAECVLGTPAGAVRHVIYLVFDNAHFTRDDPNVPSDLEQMPHLLSFLTENGVLLSKHHTVLVSHTGNGIVSSLTGLYGDRHGLPVSNSFRYYRPDGTTTSAPGFVYWTAPISDGRTPSPTNTTYTMLGADGRNAPAPWAAFTRAGCDVGVAGAANMILENPGLDVPTVFGADSVEAREAAVDPRQAEADFVGIGIHCARASALCARSTRAVPDVLPDEPGGYSGFTAVFGHRHVERLLSPEGSLTDLHGRVIGADGRNGFPGFDGMSASVSLGYVATMQERGVPVTFAYLSAPHTDRVSRRAFGPGEAGYVALLREYDDAFARFFARLAAAGITPANTLFVVGADEGDHFVGDRPNPAGCDGVAVACTYARIGEVEVNARGLLATRAGITTPFDIKSAASPSYYLGGNPPPDSASARAFGRGLATLEVVSPYSGATERLTDAVADATGMALVHMVTADPSRTPTFTQFAKPEYFLFGGAADCSAPCARIEPRFAWIHGTIAPDIVTTWFGFAGPGVRARGIDAGVWSDQADVRPTLLALSGLRDRYRHQGRALFELFDPAAVPSRIAQSGSVARRLGQAYKRIEAPVGDVGLDGLQVSTRAIAGDDATFTDLSARLRAVTRERDVIAAEMAAMLDGASFAAQPIDAARAEALIAEANDLRDRVRALATRP